MMSSQQDQQLHQIQQQNDSAKIDKYLQQIWQKYDSGIVEHWTQQKIDQFYKQLQNFDNKTQLQHVNHQDHTNQSNIFNLIRSHRKHFGGHCTVCNTPLGQQGTQLWEWCRLCGQQCCAQCVGRYRIFTKDEKLPFNNEPQAVCQTCDTKILKEISKQQQQDQIKIARQALFKVRHQLAELPNQNSYKNIVPLSEVQLKKAASSLKSINATLSMQNLELRRKITWGQDIKSKLQLRYKKVRKQVSKSMTDTSIVDEDSMNISSSIKPARGCAQSEMSRTQSQNINESTLQSVIEDESQMVDGNGKCCVACAIM